MNDVSLWPAKVVKVISDDRVVINRGLDSGLRIGVRFQLYRLDSELINDPDTGEELGRLEISKGGGVVTHVQDRMAIVFHETAFFDDPRVGDLAKPV